MTGWGVLLGMLLGALLADGRPWGWVFGAALGGLWAQLVVLRRRVEALERARVPAAPSPQALRADDAPPEEEGPPTEAAGPVGEGRPEAEPEPEPWVAAPSPAGAAAQARPATAAPWQGWLDRARVWLGAGNLPVKLGVLVLFLGVAALLRYAGERGLLDLPLELRLAAVAAGALAALGFGWARRHRQRVFALSLQGGALGVLLLTVFAAFGLYRLLPAGAAFAMVVVLVAAAGVLAVRQDAPALAVLGTVGGFLAPVLIRTGAGDHVALFGYYALLDLAVLGVAWVRPWRALNLVGFAFTFVVGAWWGQRYYRPEFLASTQPFLVLFFLFYVAIGLLYALRSTYPPQRAVDASLVFGTPLVAAGLQAGLLADRPLALAGVAVLAAGLYAALGYALRRHARLTWLCRSYLVLAVGLATAAVPLAFEARVTAQVWALEGAALVWLGLAQGRRLPLGTGLLLQAVATLLWLPGHLLTASTAPAWRHGGFVGGLVLAAALGWVAWRLERRGRARVLDRLWFAGMSLVWFVVWWQEIDRVVPDALRASAQLLWVVGSGLLATALRALRGWDRIGLLALALQAVALLLAVQEIGQDRIAGAQVLLWALWAALAAWQLRRLSVPPLRGLWLGHLLVLATAALAAGVELAQAVARWLGPASLWAALAAWLPLAVLFTGALSPRRWGGWPLAAHFEAWRDRWLLAAGTALGWAWLLSLRWPGDPAPLPFLPLLNPLELAQLAVLGLLVRAGLTGSAAHRQVWGLAGLAFWAWASVATLRAVHHLAGLPWDAALGRSMLAQAGLTVTWSVLGVLAWVAGSRRGSRPLWLGGAVLMGLVLAKLALVDRQHMGHLAGIVSFLAAGALLMVIGYLAPSPPGSREERA